VCTTYNIAQCYEFTSDAGKKEVKDRRIVCEVEQKTTTKNIELISECAEILAPQGFATRGRSSL
jgi:hypothetical protein